MECRSGLPKEIPFINGLLKKRGLQDLVGFCFIKHGNDMTVKMLDDLKEVTLSYATTAGISIGVEDMVVPPAKEQLLDQARREVLEIENQRSAGVITQGERHNKIIDIWHRVTERVSEEMFKEMMRVELERDEFNPINMGLGIKQCTACALNMAVEPDGTVLPCQSYYVPLGNILTDPWEKIWKS